MADGAGCWRRPKWVGVAVWVKSTGGWTGFEQGEGHLVFND